MNEKKKQQLSEGYEPTVSVSTKKINDKIEIKVLKIMAMAFLKKYLIKSFNHSLPPNQQDREQDWVCRLSYDIVKAHGGEIKVEQREGEGTEFTIILAV